MVEYLMEFLRARAPLNPGKQNECHAQPIINYIDHIQPIDHIFNYCPINIGAVLPLPITITFALGEVTSSFCTLICSY
jgi:hypothetical protein